MSRAELLQEVASKIAECYPDKVDNSPIAGEHLNMLLVKVSDDHVVIFTDSCRRPNCKGDCQS